MDYRDEAAVRGFVYNAGITFPVLLDMDGAVRKKYGLGVGDRKTFLLDRDGRILASLVWPGEWDAPPVVKLLRIMLWRVKNEEAPL
jgi:peroxiredoxin